MTDRINTNAQTIPVLPAYLPTSPVRMPTHTNYIFIQNHGGEIFIEFALDDPDAHVQANDNGAKKVQVTPLGRFVMNTTTALMLFELLAQTLESMGAIQRTHDQPTETES